MKKILLLIVVCLLISLCIPAQNVGIGTTNPSAQLHTTGSVRHAGLSGTGIGPVFADANGNLLVTMPALPASSSTNNTSRAIPDVSCTGATSTNSLNGLPVNVQSGSITVTINITHPRVADLSIYLLVPGGAIVNLVTPATGLTGANFTGTVFINNGPLPSSGIAPYTGQFKPYGDMAPSICGITPTAATFNAIGNGKVNPNGVWSLKIIDNTAGNSGTLNSWSIGVTSGLGIDGVWSLRGNSGTNAFNFIGTTDKQPLRLRVNNSPAGYMDTASNIFLGMFSGNENNKGKSNTGIGQATLLFNSTGSNNTGIGAGALLLNESGSFNSAIGYEVLLSNRSGNGNIAAGHHALFYNESGNNSIAIGTGALNFSNRSSLIAIGDSALHRNGIQATFAEAMENTAVGSKALYSNTKGYSNTALGYHALTFNTIGYDNTAIGANADFLADYLHNSTVVGANAVVNASNKVRIGNTSVTVIEGQVPFTSPSDGRFKTNITESVKGLDFITRLRPVVYNFQTKKYDAFLRKDFPDNAMFAASQDFSEAESIRQSGFVAQEVEKAAKESGYDFNGIIIPKNEQQTYSLSYSQFVVPLVKAVQELQQIIQKQNEKIEILQKQNEKLLALQMDPGMLKATITKQK